MICGVRAAAAFFFLLPVADRFDHRLAARSSRCPVSDSGPKTVLLSLKLAAVKYSTDLLATSITHTASVHHAERFRQVRSNFTPTSLALTLTFPFSPFHLFHGFHFPIPFLLPNLTPKTRPVVRRSARMPCSLLRLLSSAHKSAHKRPNPHPAPLGPALRTSPRSGPTLDRLFTNCAPWGVTRMPALDKSSSSSAARRSRRSRSSASASRRARSSSRRPTSRSSTPP